MVVSCIQTSLLHVTGAVAPGVGAEAEPGFELRQNPEAM